MFDSHKLAWAAGLFDGEGSIQLLGNAKCFNSLQIIVSITMTDENTIKTFGKIFGGGSIDFVPARKINHKNAWKFSIRGQYAIGLITLIFPYLVTKQKHAEILITYGKDCLGPFNRFKPMSDVVIKKRGILKARLDELNYRGV